MESHNFFLPIDFINDNVLKPQRMCKFITDTYILVDSNELVKAISNKHIAIILRVRMSFV